ncbi:MAG: polyphosphate polymerase domain-containing protein [Erysipelotrichaceae bacterium]|nr:polyphosphate polymerase domain-containing protein [Erysipelotrichaceae bacterium]
MEHYRHEWKHELSYSDLLAIRQRLQAVTIPDPHAIDGKYFIRSLYFDNVYDKALREKIDGVNMREKFRIRYYNHDPSIIHLEKKSKVSGLGTKYSANLTAEQAQRIVDHDIAWMKDSEESLIQELYLKMQYQGMRPQVIVDYTREPYIYPPGNVRVTFDYDIRTGLHCTDFLNPDCVTIPAVDSGIILEVKWDAYLPSIIRDCVLQPGRRVTAFSKYAQCRMYD